MSQLIFNILYFETGFLSLILTSSAPQFGFCFSGWRTSVECGSKSKTLSLTQPVSCNTTCSWRGDSESLLPPVYTVQREQWRSVACQSHWAKPAKFKHGWRNTDSVLWCHERTATTARWDLVRLKFFKHKMLLSIEKHSWIVALLVRLCWLLGNHIHGHVPPAVLQGLPFCGLPVKKLEVEPVCLCLPQL